MIGNHVDGEYRHGGSNPPLSATKYELVEEDGLFYYAFLGTRESFPHHEKYGIDMPLRIALGSDDGRLLFLTWLRYNYLMTHA